VYMGEILRYPKIDDEHIESFNGLRNFYMVTKCKYGKRSQLEKGINTVASVNAVSGMRTPAILIRSSPHKIGSHETPWQDFFDPDNGHIFYYGDNKSPDKRPETMNGNKSLLGEYKLHKSSSPTDRMTATPLIFFKTVPVNGLQKGHVRFEGYGIIDRIHLVTQFGSNRRYFSNYAFDYIVFSLQRENERFNWEWINARRNPSLSLEDTLEYAPQAWKDWVKHGENALKRCRRRVSSLMTTKTQLQRPTEGTREHSALTQIYNHYALNRSNFECLAAKITKRIIEENGVVYDDGWITPSTNDGGADFIGRIDVGSGFATAKLIVLGQAKCENPTVPTSGQHIARTVARLKRGWIGAYVTTSFFSEPVQREIIEDSYPLLLINGLRVAKEVLNMVQEGGFASLEEFLLSVAQEYKDRRTNRTPEEILRD
jgi:hypothetical protein